MTSRPWTVPAVSAVLALALAVTGGIIGASFAEPEKRLTTTGSAPATVIAPISVGEAPAADLDTGAGDDDPIAVSRAVAERDVLLPVADTGPDPIVGELIEELGGSPDPVFDLILLDGEAEGEDAGTDDDPCAPRGDDETEACPEGVRGTVLGLTGIVEFRAGGQAWPPTRAEFLEHGNPAGGSQWCDPDEFVAVGEDPSRADVPFGILSTAPASFTLRLWPSERPGEIAVIDDISTGAEGRSAYDAYLADPDDPALYPLLRHCIVLPGLENDTPYTAVLRGVDESGRTSAPHTIRFHTAGSPVHPGAKIVTIGENLVLISALHPRDERVDIRMSVMGVAEAGSSCSELSTGTRLAPLTETTVDADEEETAAVNAPPTFVRKQVTSFAVPEGATVLVCTRWYPDASAPSWERDVPVFESSAILQSPDRVLPSLSLTAVHPYARGLERLTVEVAGVEGARCGSTSWLPERTSLPLRACAGNWVSTGGAGTDGYDRLFDRGFSGDLVVTLTSSYADGAQTVVRHIIASTDRGCRGDCELPPDAYYRVALPTVDQPVGLCGTGLGGCTPPTRSVSGGSVDLLVDWSQGLSNGRSSWSQTATVDAAPEYVRPDAPQFELNERWTFTAPSFPPGPGAPFEWVTGRFVLRVDRPVDYTMSFLSDTDGEIGERCDRTGGPLTVEGRIERTGTIVMPGACLGGAYFGELTLRDDDGNTATWSVIDRTHYWGMGGIITAPGLETTIHYSISAQGYERSALARFRFSVGYWDANAVDTRSGRCLSDGIVQSVGSFPVVLDTSPTVHLELQLNVSSSWTPDSCSRTAEDGVLQNLVVPVTLAELFGGEQLVITAPEPYGVRIVLRAERP